MWPAAAYLRAPSRCHCPHYHVLSPLSPSIWQGKLQLIYRGLFGALEVLGPIRKIKRAVQCSLPENHMLIYLSNCYVLIFWDLLTPRIGMSLGMYVHF
ncbi:hypothetical protein PVAP13_8KG143504 [Panicum virgatum]|uniref:Uncharacterized protein n=1 Tax=Panicum virgatum TaxID=38727 RepID=A0A8T0PLS3_PANVG|nr:hypothetical protein PVAP13_8KG143504 [Panicum virgatum]